MFWNRDIKSIKVSDQKKTHDQDSATNKRRVFKRGNGFDVESYSKIEHLAKKFMADSSLKSRIKRKQKKESEKKTPGLFSAMDYKNINGLWRFKGINSSRKQTKEIKLSHFRIEVEDADTIILHNKISPSNKPIFIRMAGIDAPEVQHTNETKTMSQYRINQGQPLGVEATSRLKKLISDSSDLKLFVDPTKKTYGRYLGVLLDGNKNLNLDLVKTGHVSALEFGQAKDSMVDMGLFNAEGQSAETSQKGIWKDPFFKNWKAFSEGAGGDITFNTFTDQVKMTENKALAVGAGYIWSGQENMPESYMLGKAYREIKEQQQMERHQLRSNDARNPQSRRQDRGLIEGLQHGWFGRRRSENTAFGSPLRRDDDAKRVSKALDEALSLDIETKSLKSFHGSVIQIAVDTQLNGKHEFNITQRGNSYKTSFIKEHTLRGMGENRFTKNSAPRVIKNNLYGDFTTRTSSLNKTMDAVNLLLEQGKKSALLIHNANFEWDQLNRHLAGSGAFKFSSEYIEARDLRFKSLLKDKRLLSEGEISAEIFASNRIKDQKDVFKVVKRDLLKGNSIVDTQEIARTLNAVAQEKGLIAKTGKVEIGTKLDWLSQSFLQRTETHVGVFDNVDMKQSARRMTQMIEKIERGGDNWTEAEKRWLKSWGHVPGQVSNKSLNDAAEALLLQSEIQKIERDPHKFNKAIKQEEAILGSSGINFSKIREQARKTAKIKKSKYTQKITSNKSILSKVHPNGHMPSRGQVNTGALVLGGLALAAATISSLGSMNSFSGRDDEANTIEGLRHGWFGNQRNENVPFGSGYKALQQHNTTKAQETYDPISPAYLALGGLGTAGVYTGVQWNKLSNTKLSEIGHLGQMHATMSNEEFLGREFATVGEVLTAGVKRAERSLGGLFRVFGISDQMSIAINKNIEITLDLLDSSMNPQIKAIHKISGRNLAEEGITSIRLKKNKLWALDAQTGKYSKQIAGYYHPLTVFPNKEIAKAPSQFVTSYFSSQGLHGAETLEQNLFIVGAETEAKAAGKVAHAFGHESFSKGMKVLDEPLGALGDVLPNIKENELFQKIRKTLTSVPGLGTGGDYSGGLDKLVKRHGMRLLGAAGILGIGYGTVDWLTRNSAPENSIVGQAGVAGLGAEAIRAVHQTYAYASEASGLTSMRSAIDKSSGGDGWTTAFGFSLSGMLAGATLATVGNLSEEIGSSDRYSQFKKNIKATESIDLSIKFKGADFNLNELPGFKGKSTHVGKYAKLGALAGATLALPFILSGLGASQSSQEVEDEYAGKKLVAIKKGRFWEGSMTPWGGGETAYYRPNWYAKMKDDPRKQVLYGGDDVSPMGKVLRSLWDPYWLEKKNFKNSPYPFTGPDGSSMGMFGPIYEMTLGRALKSPAYINKEEADKAYLESQDKYPVSEALGGLPKGTPRDPSSFTALGRDAIRTVTEGLGLRTFAMSSIVGRITGESNIDAYTPEYESASKLDSLNSKFYDLQLGGGGLTTEAIRRLLPKETQGETQYVNQLRNAMPSWLPGDRSKYHMNFQRGDAYTKISDGYYRLPGEGYATRHEELKGLDPEDYPDIYKYEILADVAPFSKEFKSLRGRLQNRDMDERTSVLFNRIEKRLSDKKKTKEVFRDPAVYNNPLGQYTSILTDTLRANPAEHLLPFSPARKFLPAVSPLDRYKEKVYGKDFQDWKDPVGDFIMPAINMTRDIVGLASTPEEIEYARKTEDYYDRLKYIKAKKLAAEAAAKGDKSSESYYRSQADRTMTGLDPYMDSNELLGRINKRERPFFEHFINAEGSERDKVLELAPDSMKEIYQAQWNKKDMLARGQEDQLYQQAEEVRGRRRSEAKKFDAPDAGWIGWNQQVDLEDVKMQQLVNEGRDYHYYGLWQDRLNLLGRKPYIQEAVSGINTGSTQLEDYMEAAENASQMQLLGGRITVMPGIDSSYNIDISVDRRRERNEKLHKMGYL